MGIGLRRTMDRSLTVDRGPFQESIGGGVTHLRNVDVLLWMLLCGFLLGIGAWPHLGAALHTDSVQYLSGAENLLQGRIGYTTLVYYDAERSIGVVPAPMVTFPMGYSAAIALIAIFGVPLTTAGFLVSATATLSMIPLLAWATRIVGLPRYAGNFALAALVFNEATLDYGTKVMSEALFGAVSMLGVALLLRARRCTSESRVLPWIVAGLAFGVGYHVRYAGLFFIASLLIVSAANVAKRRLDLALGHLIAFAVSAAIALVAVVRNFVLVSHWRGDNRQGVEFEFSMVAYESLRVANGLLFGLSGFPWSLVIPRVVFLVIAAGLVSWMIRSRISEADRLGRVERMGPDAAVGDLSLVLITYTGCMLYAGLTPNIVFGVRMFVPLVPICVLVLAAILFRSLRTTTLDSRERRLVWAAVVAAYCIYVSLNMLCYFHRVPFDAVGPVAMRLDTEESNGETARRVILDLLGSDGVMVANEGQVIGHALGVRTVSLPDPRWSSTNWDLAAIRGVLVQFRASALVVWRPTSRAEFEELTSDQLALAAGSSPDWMRRVFFSEHFVVYAPTHYGWRE
jgi:hypothetical protein